MSKSSTRFITTAMREAEEGPLKSVLFVRSGVYDLLSQPFSILGLHSRFIRVPSSWSHTMSISGDIYSKCVCDLLAYAAKKDAEK
jgi:hypothetical protein